MEKLDPRLTQLVAGIYAFYGQEATDFDLAFWVRALAGFPYDDLRTAFDAHLCDERDCRFIPKPGQIIARLRPSEQERIMEAWRQVLAAGRNGIVYDPIAKRALAVVGGQRYLGSAQEYENPRLFRIFEQAYSALLKREERESFGVGAIIAGIGHEPTGQLPPAGERQDENCD